MGVKHWTTYGTFLGALIGLVLGWIYGPAMESVKWMGDLFLSLLRFLVMPLILSAMVVGVSGLGDVRKMGRFGGMTVAYFIGTTLISVAIGLILVIFIKPGSGFGISDVSIPQRISAMQDYSFSDFILSFVGGGAGQGKHNANLFYSLTHMEMLPVILFSLALGAIVASIGETGRPVLSFFRGFYEIVMIMVQGIIFLAPLGVFGLVASKIGGVGGGVAVVGELKKVGMYCFTVVLGLGIHGILVLPLILKIVGRRSPLQFLRGMSEALLTAFSTASSAATLPITTRNAISKNGVSEKSANFVLPVGATVNMDGTALYEGVAVVFIAQTLGVQLSLGQLVLIFILANMAAIAAAAIPEAGLVTMVVILQAVNLPIEAIGILLAVDWFLDRCRTTVNVWGDSIGSATLDRLYKHIGGVKLQAF